MFKIEVIKNNRKIKEAIFDKSIVSIGRHDVNDIQLGKYDRPLLVSRFHAAIIENEQGAYFIRDLGSKNGVRVNGEGTYRKILKSRDLIEIGGYVLKFEIVRKEEVILTPDTPRKKTRKHIISVKDDSTEVHSEEKELDSTLLLLGNASDPDSFLTQFLYALCHVSSADVGYCAEIVNDGFTFPRHTKGLTNYEIPRPSEKLFKQMIKENSISIDFALREGEVQEKLIAMCVPLRLDQKFYLFYLEIPKETYERKGKNILSELLLLLKKVRKYIPSSYVNSKTQNAMSFRWKEKMVCNTRLPCMAEVMQRLDKTSKNNLNVLICGETGTGKEVAAKKIHSLSGRKGKFVAINCKEVPANLLADRLFGHIKGAFSSADRSQPGVFEKAHEGTLFLDEVGCLDLELQQMLLRPLREKKIMRLGDTKERKIDVKIVFATNEDLGEKVDRALMRKDFLYGRILEENPPIEIPPLRKRKEDIPLLVNFFIDEATNQKVKGIHHGALYKLYKSDHQWPANVQELKNVILKALSLARSEGREIILWEDIRFYSPTIPAVSVQEAFPCERFNGMEKIECEAIIHVLRETRGNVAQAAKILGISRPTLYKKCNSYGIDLNAFKK